MTKRAAQRGVDWFVQRIATSEHYVTDPERVRYEWTFDALVEAHLTLDALDEIQLIYRPDPPKTRGGSG